MQIAIKAWNLLGGLDWAGVDAVADLLGIEDIDMLIHQLAAIRNYQQRAE